MRIHSTPELAFQERQSSAWLAGALEREGFQVQRAVAGLETSFLASYRGGDGPILALVAEYDALPGVGHGCGHNIIGTSAVGAAMALKETWPDLPGTVLLVGCPAEETGGGKAYLVEAGVFEGISAALMVHPNMRTQVVASLISMQEIQVEYFGRSAHAASQPHDGINALDALVLAYVNIAALRQHVRPGARVHGVITHGGEAPNVIPDYAAGRFYVRGPDDDYQAELQERVIACFKAGAEATGARLEYRCPAKRYSAMRSNPTLAEVFRANMTLLGIEETPPDPKRGMGSSDMGNVSTVVPALHPSLAIAPQGTPSHSLVFAEYSRSDAGHDGLVLAARLMALTILDLLEQPELLARAQEEFRAGKVAIPPRA